MKSLADIEFQFTEKCDSDDYAVWLSEALKNPIPRSLILSGPELFWSLKEQLVRDTLNHLSIKQSRIVVIANDHSIIDKTGPWHQEP